jgi:hypothetical protein
VGSIQRVTRKLPTQSDCLRELWRNPRPYGSLESFSRFSVVNSLISIANLEESWHLRNASSYERTSQWLFSITKRFTGSPSRFISWAARRPFGPSSRTRRTPVQNFADPMSWIGRPAFVARSIRTPAHHALVAEFAILNAEIQQ